MRPSGRAFAGLRSPLRMSGCLKGRATAAESAIVIGFSLPWSETSLVVRELSADAMEERCLRLLLACECFEQAITGGGAELAARIGRGRAEPAGKLRSATGIDRLRVLARQDRRARHGAGGGAVYLEQYLCGGDHRCARLHRDAAADRAVEDAEPAVADRLVRRIERQPALRQGLLRRLRPSAAVGRHATSELSAARYAGGAGRSACGAQPARMTRRSQ